MAKIKMALCVVKSVDKTNAREKIIFLQICKKLVKSMTSFIDSAIMCKKTYVNKNRLNVEGVFP